jgi:acyl-CoA synthetase (AMP-forming)/AMP-acid ligase II
MGGVSVGLNPTLKPTEFKHIFRDSEASAVIVSDNFHGVDPISIIREMRTDLPHLRQVIVIGDVRENEISYQNLVDSAMVRDDYHKADPNDLAILVYTSGTTGLPKGSMHSHLTALRPAIRGSVLPTTLKELLHLIKHFGFGIFFRMIKVLLNPIKVYGSTPPYTAAGMIGGIGLFLGGYISYQLDRYIPAEVLKLVDEEKINIISFPPAVGALLLKNPDLPKYDLSSLIAITLGAAPVPPSLVDEFLDKIGVPVAIGYGASELLDTPSATIPWRDSKKALRETVGLFNSDYEGKVVNEDRETLPHGEVGELAVRGKVKMLGYYKAETLTRDTFDEDGWYFTGDLATIDEDGYIRIVGRVKDLIIRGGQNIYPAEIEDVINTHPKVKQSSVVGIPDAVAGEKVLAFIIPEDDSEPTVLEIMEFCRENIASYKVPGFVYFVDEFPLNATGKVLKRVLREEAIKSS